MKPNLRYFLLISMALFLSACATRTSPSDIVQQQFMTDIKDDGSKLFVYIASFKVARPSNTDKVFLNQTNTGKSPRISQSRKLEEKLANALEHKITSTGYCRKGYFVLSQYIQFGSGEIRGECRESASKEDRVLFGS